MVIAIIRAQEEERGDSWGHPRAGRAISNVVIRAEICKQLSIERPDLLEELEGLVATANNSLEDIRRIIFNLDPCTLTTWTCIHAVSKVMRGPLERGRHKGLIGHTGCDRRFDDTRDFVYRIVRRY